MEHPRNGRVSRIHAVRQPERPKGLKVLLVSYPLLSVSSASAGGAEQILWALERELDLRGYDTSVAAANGSRISGRLIATGEPATEPDRLAEREQQQAEVLASLLRTESFDVIHDMSGSWWRTAPSGNVLATLHLPRNFYPDGTFEGQIPDVRFACVSESQARTFHDLTPAPAVVPNGIALDLFTEKPLVPMAERQYLLWLGRICEEKGPHRALDVAFGAGLPMIIAGSVYPLLYHQKFHAREVLPRLRRSRHSAKFINAPSFGEKINLLRNAKALLITSTARETSSLVAMEAAACGTPVLALNRGAIGEVVAEGVTGWLAEDIEHMRSLLPLLREIDSATCREYALDHFSARRMADRYVDLYQELRATKVQEIRHHA